MERTIDLHINSNKLAKLSSHEKFLIQIELFEQELNSAIISGLYQITFIHGLGKAKLKQEITKILKNDYTDYFFKEADYYKYGYGALTVYLK